VSVRYVLAPRAVVARARMGALAGAAVAVAPAWLVIVLVAQLGLASRGLVVGSTVAVALLGLARGVLHYLRARRRLSAFAIDVEGEELAVSTVGGPTRVRAGAVARVTEVEGAYGGLRVELEPHAAPSRFDVPRGGESFGELRAWLASRAPIVRAARRGLPARIALVAAVVLALFFAPFVVADARGSRVAVALVLLVAWGAMRGLAARG
jgi:hypothetical protein